MGPRQVEPGTPDRASTADLERHRTQIDKLLRERPVNKVLHGFPSPMYWYDIAKQLDPHPLRRSGTDIDVYMGMPFCPKTDPDRCGFCLFPTVEFEGMPKLEEYLGYLEREVELLRPHTVGRRVNSVFFGGGTPNLVAADGYERLVAMVRHAFHGQLGPEVEVTIEGIPQLFNRKKLDAMKAAGVNRLSMGVQQLDDELIKFSGRKQRNQQVFDTLSYAREIGIKSSIDLIFGWPQQTIDRMLAGLRLAVGTGVKHLTHYELNVGGATDFATRRRDELPSIEEVREMARVAGEFLEAHGYSRLTVYDWTKNDGDDEGEPSHDDGRLQFEEAYFQRPGFSDILGIGYAAFSTLLGSPEAPGLVYMNHRRLPDYYSAIEAGRFPIERGFVYTADELRLHWLFRHLETLRVNRRDYARLFGTDTIADFGPIWQSLEERGWLSVTDDIIELVGDGMYLVPLVQGLLSSDMYRALQKSYKQLPLRLLSA